MGAKIRLVVSIIDFAVLQAQEMLTDALDFEGTDHFITDFLEAEDCAKRCAREYMKAAKDLFVSLL